MESASCELLRALRGPRSQVAFSRRLGYRSNQSAEWEAGRKFPTAARMLQACGRVGIDVVAALRRFHPNAAPALQSIDDPGVASWLRELRGSSRLVHLASRSGLSRFAVSRFLNGQTRPRVPDFLRLLDALTGRAADFVGELVPIEAVPSLGRDYAARAAARRVAFEEPWSEAILRVMETPAYQAMGAHQPGWIAARLGIEEEAEQRCLNQMQEAGVVVREGERYRDTDSLTVDTTALDEVRQLKSHWSRTALQRLQDPREQDIFSYNVFSGSHHDVRRVRELLRSTYREIRSILASSSPTDTVAFVNLQMVHWVEPNEEPLIREEPPTKKPAVS